MQINALKKIVIVDDSKAMRSWLRVILERDARLLVVGEAGNAQEARKVIKQTAPDVITLDIEMPGMSGLRFLEKLMLLRPTPVVMIAGNTKRDSKASIEALSLGAVDCILKPTTTADEAFMRDLTRRVFSAACSNVQALQAPKVQRPTLRASRQRQNLPIILIGASTGGIAALDVVLSDLNPAGPPVVVVQHMPGAFLVGFSQHLNRKLPQDIRLAREGETLESGMIRLAPALGQHTSVQRCDGMWACTFAEKEEKALHCPSVNHLFKSAYPHAQDVIAVILTGLGRDGAAALYELRHAGSRTIGQDAPSCIVYGMPRAAYEIGAVETQAHLSEIGRIINTLVSKMQARKSP